MAPRPDEAAIDPGRFFSTYRWRIVAIGAVAGIVGFLVGRTLPTRYEATTVITLDTIAPVEDAEAEEVVDVSADAAEIELDTQISVSQSLDVERIAADELAIRNPNGLAASLSVSLVEDTNLLRFTYEHSDPRIAQQRSRAFAEAYLEFRRRVQVGSVLNQASDLEGQLDFVEKDLKQIRERAAHAEDPIRQTALNTFAGVLEGTATEIEFELSRLAEVPSVGSIVQPAGLPGAPSGRVDLLAGALGVLVGIVAGTIYAARRSRRDDKALSNDEIEAVLQAPIIGRIPRSSRWRVKPSPVPGARLSVAAGAYRVLRTNLLSVMASHGWRSVLITSATTFEGKSVVAGNLAIVVARSGKRAVLVSADVREDRVSSLMGRVAAVGLTDVITGKAQLERSMFQVQHNLDLLPAGTPPGDAARLLSSDAMSDLLSTLEERTDLVIIDGGAVLGTADTIALAPLVDAVLFVTDGHVSLDDSLSTARTKLAHVGATIAGVALYEPLSESPARTARALRPGRAT